MSQVHSGMVVYIGKPIDCATCKGTGLQASGFMHGPRGPICEACSGAKMTHEAMSIEDFAKLFRTEVVYGNMHGPGSYVATAQLVATPTGGGEPR